MTPTSLACFRCGYDLRAHPDDGICPECALTLVESRRLSALRRRLDWQDSDPRWRRRILAGLWVLVLIPLMSVLKAIGVSAALPVHGLFIIHNDMRTLDNTLLASFGVFESLMFCIGTALLFATERNRRLTRFDWTRRWGLLCSYVTLLFSAASTLFIAALVGVGIAALFLSMPARSTPAGTMALLNICANYLRFGPQEGNLATPVRVIFSSAVMLLACAPLFDALRRTGIKRLAVVAIVPLAAFSVLQCVAEALSYYHLPGIHYNGHLYTVYFCPQLFIENSYPSFTNSPNMLLSVELIKWANVLAIAIWLTITQFKRRPRPSGEI